MWGGSFPHKCEEARYAALVDDLLHYFKAFVVGYDDSESDDCFELGLNIILGDELGELRDVFGVEGEAHDAVSTLTYC